MHEALVVLRIGDSDRDEATKARVALCTLRPCRPRRWAPGSDGAGTCPHPPQISFSPAFFRLTHNFSFFCGSSISF